MPRPQCPRRVAEPPRCLYFKPAGIPMSGLEEVALSVDELEALRLADLEGLYQDEAASRMGVSRPTFARIVEASRRKVADALVHGRALRIGGGRVAFVGRVASDRVCSGFSCREPGRKAVRVREHCGGSPMSDANRFDEAAITWDEQPRRVMLARAVADAITRQLCLSRDLDVLDFGCGTGLLTLALQPLVRSVTGADTSPGMLEVLGQKVRTRGLTNVETILLDAGLPLSVSTRFHLIVSSMALHHVASLAPLFERFHEQLHPGGRLALADLDREDGSFHEDPREVHHLGFERSELQAALSEAGFVGLGATTAVVTRKESRDYPVFLITGQKLA
jgi:tRNA (cmo5U34)-methyltransferase